MVPMWLKRSIYNYLDIIFEIQLRNAIDICSNLMHSFCIHANPQSFKWNSQRYLLHHLNQTSKWFKYGTHWVFKILQTYEYTLSITLRSAIDISNIIWKIKSDNGWRIDGPKCCIHTARQDFIGQTKNRK